MRPQNAFNTYSHFQSQFPTIYCSKSYVYHKISNTHDSTYPRVQGFFFLYSHHISRCLDASVVYTHHFFRPLYLPNRKRSDNPWALHHRFVWQAELAQYPHVIKRKTKMIVTIQEHTSHACFPRKTPNQARRHLGKYSQ